MNHTLKIGELAERSGCLVETIRYYEKVGLLAAPARAENNYRTYTAAHAETLLFIRHCRALDISIDEIRVLLEFRNQPDDACTGVNGLLDKHIRTVGDRIRALSALETQLLALRGRCAAEQPGKDCGILQALAAV